MAVIVLRKKPAVQNMNSTNSILTMILKALINTRNGLKIDILVTVVMIMVMKRLMFPKILLKD